MSRSGHARGRVCLLGLLSLVASPAHAGAVVDGPPQAVRARAFSLERGLERLMGVAGEWYRFDEMETMPVVVASGDWSILLQSKPAAGFVPIEGKDCPCARRIDNFLPGMNSGQIWLITARTQPVIWRYSGHVAARLAPGELLAMVVFDNGSVLAAVTHELFHLYQDNSWDFPEDFEGYGMFLVGRSTASAAMRPLLQEQLLLARALREEGGARIRDLRQWSKVRRWLAARGIIGRMETQHELLEGTATCAESEVAGQQRRDRQAMEQRLAWALDAGGRDLTPEDWFHRQRYYATGAALCLLLSDGWPGWQSSAFESQQPSNVSLASELEKRIGPLNTGAASSIPPGPEPLALHASNAYDVIALQHQALATIVVEVPRGGYPWGTDWARQLEKTTWGWLAVGDASAMVVGARANFSGAFRQESNRIRLFAFGSTAAAQFLRLEEEYSRARRTTLSFRSPQLLLGAAPGHVVFSREFDGLHVRLRDTP